MSVDYDILLGDHTGLHGYRVRSITRDSAPLIAPRFSTGAQSQTDLDLLKSKSLDNFAGGMFQREWDDDKRAMRVLGTYNRYDDNLYPAPKLVSPTSSPSVRLTAKVESKMFTFFALGNYAAGNYSSALYKLNNMTGALETITLPSAIANNTSSYITGLTLHKGFLYVFGKLGDTPNWFSPQKMSLATNSFSTLGSGHAFWRGATLRGSLYLFYLSGSIHLAASETTTTMTTTQIYSPSFGSYEISALNDVEEFNGALYLAMQDGLYRFDGRTAPKILSLAPRWIKAFNGALYFVASGWLYRFDGANLEKLQYFGEESVDMFSADDEYLYIATTVTDGSYSSDAKPNTGGTSTLRVYVWDGAAFYLWNERDIDVGLYPAIHTLVVSGKYVLTGWYRYSDSGTYIEAGYMLLDRNQKGSIEFTLSDFDDGFPNILKSLENIHLLYQNKHDDDAIILQYQFYTSAGWQTWQTVSIQDALADIDNPLPKLFLRHRIFVSVAVDADSSIALKGVAFGYTLQPRSRWRWQLLLRAEGNGEQTTILGDPINTDSNVLANRIDWAIKSKTPQFIAQPDYARLKAPALDTDTILLFGGSLSIYTSPYGDPVYIAVKNDDNVWEILKVETVTYNAIDDETVVEVVSRGYLGITPGEISTSAEMRIVNKVYITRLLRESPVLDENTRAEQDTGESQLQRQFLLEITEV